MASFKTFLLIAAMCSFICLGLNVSAAPGFVRWVNVTNDKLLQGNWAPVGVENGEDLYLARAYHYDENMRSWHYINGKLQVGQEIKATIAQYEERDHSYQQFQMLSAPPGTLSWIPLPWLPDNPFPTGAIVGGFLPVWNVTVYVCRTSHTDREVPNLIPGYMWPNHGHENQCYFPFEGGQHAAYGDVEILVINNYGRATGVVQEE